MSKNRFKGYKEDSTRGKSMLRPKKYKGDAMVQVWMDSRVLATISIWLDREGMSTRFMSEVVRDGLKVFVDYLVDVGEVEMVDDTEDARDMLERKYRIDLNPNGRGLKNALHNKLLCEDRKGLRDSIEGRRGVADVRIPAKRERVKGIDLDIAVKIYEAKRKQDMEDARQLEWNRFKANADIDENGIVQNVGEDNNRVTEDNVCVVDKKKDEIQKEIVEEIKEERVKANDRYSPPRKLTAEEVEDKAIALEKKDREYLKMLKEMNVAPKATA